MILEGEYLLFSPKSLGILINCKRDRCRKASGVTSYTDTREQWFVESYAEKSDLDTPIRIYYCLSSSFSLTI